LCLFFKGADRRQSPSASLSSGTFKPTNQVNKQANCPLDPRLNKLQNYINLSLFDSDSSAIGNSLFNKTNELTKYSSNSENENNSNSCNNNSNNNNNNSDESHKSLDFDCNNDLGQSLSMHTLLTDTSANSSGGVQNSSKGSRKKWFEILADSNDNSGFENIDEESEQKNDDSTSLALNKTSQSSVLSEGPLKDSLLDMSSLSSTSSSYRRHSKPNHLQISIAKTNLFDKKKANQAITCMKLAKTDVDLDKFKSKQADLQKTLEPISPRSDNANQFKRPFDLKPISTGNQSPIGHSNLLAGFVSNSTFANHLGSIQTEKTALLGWH
jgi:hypothetical protein